MELFYNKTLDIISSSDNDKTSNSCIVYIVLFSVFPWLFIFLYVFI